MHAGISRCTATALDSFWRKSTARPCQENCSYFYIRAFRVSLTCQRKRGKTFMSIAMGVSPMVNAKSSPAAKFGLTTRLCPMPGASPGNTKSNSTANIFVASLRQNGTIMKLRHDSACDSLQFKTSAIAVSQRVSTPSLMARSVASSELQASKTSRSALQLCTSCQWILRFSPALERTSRHTHLRRLGDSGPAPEFQRAFGAIAKCAGLRAAVVCFNLNCQSLPSRCSLEFYERPEPKTVERFS